MKKNIVILGGSFAGISLAHRILKQAPKTTIPTFKITLISPNDHFYWSLASPLGVLPSSIGLEDDKMFKPIAPGFAHYPDGSFEFILGTAEGLDVDSKKVVVRHQDGTMQVSYDLLVLATGTHARQGLPFKGVGSTEETKRELHSLQDKIAKAKSIVVAGTGASGSETAGELGYAFGKEKEIILIASGPTILEGTPPNVHNLAQKELRKLNVNIKFNTKIASSTLLASGKTELTLASGEKLQTDLYIPAYGLAPNSSYIPAKFLNEKGYVKVDEWDFAVKGTSDVWAIGDVSNFENSQLIIAERQSVHLAKNIVLLLSGKSIVPYKKSITPIGLSIGRKAGVASLGGWRIPSFVIVYLRRNLFSENLAGFVDGSGV